MSTDLEVIEADPIASPTVVEQLTRGEVDMQVATARRWPRSVKSFRQQMAALATKSPEVARTCYYALPRGGKKITGPSIRLAEIVASSWGNMRCETRVLGTDDKLIIAQATAWDMQTNVLIRREVQRRITDSKGRRYNDDMIVMTGNAACSIALRNAIFSVVPRAYVDEMVSRCMAVAAGERGSMGEAVAGWLKRYAEKGIQKGQVLALLERPGVDDIQVDDIATLQGVWNAIEDGQASAEEMFGPPEAHKENGIAKFGFRARQERQKAAQTSAAKPETPAPTPPSEPLPDPVAALVSLGATPAGIARYLSRDAIGELTSADRGALWDAHDEAMSGAASIADLGMAGE